MAKKANLPVSMQITQKKKPRGPKPKFETAEQFRKAVDKYFDYMEELGKFPDHAGMCIFLGLSQKTLEQYSLENNPNHDKYADTLEYAQSRRESWLSQRMAEDPKGANGYMNLLKQKKNGGFTDRPQQEQQRMELSINLVGLGGEENFKG